MTHEDISAFLEPDIKLKLLQNFKNFLNLNLA